LHEGRKREQFEELGDNTSKKRDENSGRAVKEEERGRKVEEYFGQTKLAINKRRTNED